MNYSEALEKLNSCGQEHVLKYYGELSEESQKSLLSQIEKLDMALLNCFSQKDISGKRGNFKPL